MLSNLTNSFKKNHGHLTTAFTAILELFSLQFNSSFFSYICLTLSLIAEAFTSLSALFTKSPPPPPILTVLTYIASQSYSKCNFSLRAHINSLESSRTSVSFPDSLYMVLDNPGVLRVPHWLNLPCSVGQFLPPRVSSWVCVRPSVYPKALGSP